MYIGKLNDRAPVSSVALFGEGGRQLTGGNPFLGEVLQFPWRDITPAGLTINFTLDENVWLDSLVLRFAGNGAPTNVTLRDETGRVLDVYHGETGKPITEKQIPLRLCGKAETLVLQIETHLADICLTEIELWGAIETEEPVLWPTPRSAEYGDKRIPVSACAAASANCEAGAAALSILQEKWSEATGVSISAADEGTIRLCLDEAIADGGYGLTVDEAQITIHAADLRGFVQGVETLCKLAENGTVPVCQLKDAPFCTFRGVHLYLPAMDQMDFAKRLIKYLLSPMGYNVMILEVAGAMRFYSRPEINDAFLEANRKSAAGEWPGFPHGDVGGRKIVEQEDVRELVAYARRFGIEVVPEVQSLSHVQFMTQAYPEIGERPWETPVTEVTDERLADVPPDQFYAHCYCPSNPKSYEILFDLMDEIIDVFQPKKYVHIGHDEVYQIGVCPVCRDHDPAALLVEDITRIYNHLKAKGLTPMMWSDMLQPISSYKTPPARHSLPKDIVMLDFIWYFHFGKDIEENLLPEGYKIAVGNLYSSHFPRYESRIRQPGMIGGEVSAWVSTDEDCLGREGKLYDMLYTAEMLWWEAYGEKARYAYDRVIGDLMPKLRERLRGQTMPSLHPHGETLLDGAIEGCYDSLVFEHTALRQRHREPWIPCEEIGAYTVTYGDGTTETIPVTYGGNIGYGNRLSHQPLLHHLFRHNGYITAWETDNLLSRDETGALHTTYRLEWKNPRPEIAVTKVQFTGAEDVVVSRILGIQAE